MASKSDPAEFFVVSKGGVGSPYDTEYLKADGAAFGDAPRCEVCGQFIDGRPWLSPYEVELTLHGRSWGDFAFFGDGDFLMSERGAQMYETSGLRGLSGFEPVEVVRTHGSHEPPPTYLHVVVARSTTTVDEPRSSLKRREPVTCERCRSGSLEGIEGFRLEEGSWPGEDVFFARGLTGVVVATARFRDLADSGGLTNIRFTRTESYRWDPYAPISISD